MNLTQLISGCKTNNRVAQHQLYQQFADKLMNICMRYCTDIREAQDGLQSAFIKIFTRIDQFDERKGTFENWAIRIAVNEVLMMKRKNKKYLFVEDMQMDFDQYTEPTVFSEFSVSEIKKVIDRLPDGYRMIFNLYVVEDFSHKEIAEMLSISENTSRSQLLRARKAIQTHLLKNMEIPHGSQGIRQNNKKGA